MKICEDCNGTRFRTVKGTFLNGMLYCDRCGLLVYKQRFYVGSLGVVILPDTNDRKGSENTNQKDEGVI